MVFLGYEGSHYSFIILYCNLLCKEKGNNKVVVAFLMKLFLLQTERNNKILTISGVLADMSVVCRHAGGVSVDASVGSDSSLLPKVPIILPQRSIKTLSSKQTIN